MSQRWGGVGGGGGGGGGGGELFRKMNNRVNSLPLTL